MKHNEYNYFEEVQKTDECQNYEAVKPYILNNEMHISKKETLIVEEYGINDRNKKKLSNKGEKGFVRKIIQKVSEVSSTLAGGIAATASVVVVSVITFSSIFIKPPNIELLEFETGYNHVFYNLYISQTNEEYDYYSIVSNNFETHKNKLKEGENINRINDLIHNIEYDFSVVGIKKDDSEIVTYFEKTFYTTKEENSVRVSWEVEGIVVETDEIDYGQIPIYDGLTPTKDMTLDEYYEFAGWDKEIVAATEDVTYTAIFNVIPYEYKATFNQVTASGVDINYDNVDYYVMTFNTGFDNSLDSRLSYKIILTDLNTGKTYVYKGVDQIAKINVDSSVTKLSITYETIGTYNGIEKVFDSITMSEQLEINAVDVEISNDLKLVATDEYQLSFIINSKFTSAEIFNSLTMLVNYNDSSSKEIVIQKLTPNEKMFVSIPVPSYCSSFTLDYSLDVLGVDGHSLRKITGTKEFSLNSEFELVRTYADTNEYMNVRFLFKYHFADQETTLAIKDSLTTNVTTIYEGVDYIEVYLDDSVNQQEFIYYLSSLDGTAKGTENSLVINKVSVSAVYDFQYVNPGEAVVTFNEDETMNIYLNTIFETEDADVWYLVRYTDFNNGVIYDEKYTESVAYLEHVPFSDYGIEYFVYKTVEGIDYQLKHIAVSGGVEVMNMGSCGGEVQELSSSYINIYINYYDYYNIDSESLVLVIDGIEHKIPSSTIVENDGFYEINYSLDYMPNELILKYVKKFNEDSLYEQISANREIIGVQNKTIYLTLI